jgi:hypothetical protein
MGKGRHRRLARRAVERRVIEVAGDEPRREPHGARALHHQQRVVAASAAAGLQGGRGRLGAGLEAHGVLQRFLDAPTHTRQHGERVGAVLSFEELLGPAAHRGVRVGIVALDIARKVGRLLGEIGERQLLGILLDRRQLGRQAEMLQPDGAGKLQQLGSALERREGNRVTERIVDPAHLGRRLDRQSGVKQTKVVAVARPEHQAVLAQCHRCGILVARTMDDLERAHGLR